MEIIGPRADRRIGLNGLMETAEADFGNFRIKYFEAICEMALVRKSGS
jgi:hypothetical protein